MKKTIVVLMIIVAILTVFAVRNVKAAGTYLAYGATILEVANTGDNLQKFAIRVTGGSGPCTGGVWIHFPLSAAPDADTHKRAYANALVAFAMNRPVTIYNYTDGNCAVASYISISK